ncbi:hypothetical protein CLAIMM_02565 [Cladophialophora immunda]|nr:hypothetical protein CLAIMM_02565 [Cladophialophora immunda]
MKPVVSALNAWSCTVLSVFAIVILSVIGSLFAVRARPVILRSSISGASILIVWGIQRDHHMMMGMEEDPEDGGAVAASIFIAVAVYAVSLHLLDSYL